MISLSVIGCLFVLFVWNEARAWKRRKRALARLEHGSSRGGYIEYGGTKL